MSQLRESDYISITRDKARQLWDAVTGLKAMQAEWTAMDYENTLDNFEGNDEVTTPDIRAAVFDVADGIITNYATAIATLL